MRGIDRISTNALQIDTDDLMHVLFHKITRQELQEIYDYCGRDAGYLKKQLALGIGSRRFARKLLDAGVVITGEDLKVAQAERQTSLAETVAQFDIGDDFDPAELMKEAAELRLDPTIFNKMDFRELPNPRNVLDWITGNEFLGSSPFPRQLQICLGLTEEYCAYCSDLDFVKDMHLSPFLGEDGVHYRAWTIQEILARITLLEHGVCPKCRRTYNEMLAEKLHRFPNDLVACCGQRCVAGDTLILTRNGLIPIESMVPDTVQPDTFYPLDGVMVHTGTEWVPATDVYYAGVGPSIRITTSTGASIVGSRIHPVRVCDGPSPAWRQMQDIIPGALVIRANGRGGMCIEDVTHVDQTGSCHLFDLHVPGKHQFVSNGFISHNSGKTIVSGFLGTYYNARYQLLRPTPQKFFGEEAKQKFTAIYTAINLTQSVDTLWGAYHTQVKEAPWYSTYHEWLNYHGKKHGVELFRIQETQHIWGPTLIQDRLLAPRALNMRGRTGYSMGIDEIGLFARTADAVIANGDEVYTTLTNATLTIRSAAAELNRRGKYTPTAPMFCISSPWELLDKIMRMVREAPRVPNRVAYHYATWEMNPKIHRDSDIMVAAYAADGVKAHRDFGAVPPLADNPFHSNEAAIDSLPAKDTVPYFVQSLKRHVSPHGVQSVYAVPTHVRPDVGARIMCLDSGESNNSFALTLWGVHRGPPPAMTGSLNVYEDIFMDDEDRNALEMGQKYRIGRKGGTDGTVRYLRCDGVIEVSPPEDHKVNFKLMYDLAILPIIRSFRVIAMVSDRWNMSQIVSSLEEEGVRCHQYTPVWNDFLAFRARTNRREVIYPKLERPYESIYDNFDGAIAGAPGLHLLVQTKTVRQVGRKVDKPKGGTDDLYRTAVLAHRFAMNDDRKDKFAVSAEGVPYATILETQSKIIPGYGGPAAGLVMMRRDAASNGYTRDSLQTNAPGVGGYRSFRVRSTGNKNNRGGPNRGRR